MPIARLWGTLVGPAQSPWTCSPRPDKGHHVVNINIAIGIHIALTALGTGITKFTDQGHEIIDIDGATAIEVTGDQPAEKVWELTAKGAMYRGTRLSSFWIEESE